jgi:hypothetical protein
LVSFLPLSLLPIKPNMTQIPNQREKKSLKFDRNQILNRYWELANLDIEETKGNITGQLKALDSLCEQLAITEKPGTPAPTQEIYRSAWMTEVGSASTQ